MARSTRRSSGRARTRALLATSRVDDVIHVVRGERVILDCDLARLYGVTTKRLNEQVRRNPTRFPSDFMFELSPSEAAGLRSQNATSKVGRGGARYRPHAFTEHGAVMAANVLSSAAAVRTSVIVVRTFVRLRQIAASNAEIVRRLDSLEAKYDRQFRGVFAAIRALVVVPSRPQKRIGFETAR